MTTIREIQEQARELRESAGFRDRSIDRRMLYLTSEVGELAREVLNLAYPKPSDSLDEIKERAGFEMYDIVWNICDLADLLEIDIESAFARKAALNRTRRW
jgi:NTP pyrophosphatase (non-canonical NTP hydrolase)